MARFYRPRRILGFSVAKSRLRVKESCSFLPRCATPVLFVSFFAFVALIVSLAVVPSSLAQQPLEHTYGLGFASSASATESNEQPPAHTYGLGFAVSGGAPESIEGDQGVEVSHLQQFRLNYTNRFSRNWHWSSSVLYTGSRYRSNTSLESGALSYRFLSAAFGRHFVVSPRLYFPVSLGINYWMRDSIAIDESTDDARRGFPNDRGVGAIADASAVYKFNRALGASLSLDYYQIEEEFRPWVSLNVVVVP